MTRFSRRHTVYTVRLLIEHLGDFRYKKLLAKLFQCMNLNLQKVLY